MRTPNRWAMLSLGMAAQAAGSAFAYGLPFLLPAFQRDYGLTLAQAGLLVGSPSVGMVATLIAWGWFADRKGERLAMALGLGLATVFLLPAAFASGPGWLGVAFALAGASVAASNAASGRVVLGWFPKEKRGVAMGWRQTAQPLGVAIAGVLLPRFGTVREAVLAMAVLCLVVAIAVALLVVDPPRPAASPGARTASPYRMARLWRVHGASMLLVVPQFATAGFALTYLVAVRHWDVARAAEVIALAQVAGAGGRLLCGRWSDLAGSRLRPMRQLAVINASTMTLLALAVPGSWGPALMITAMVVSMSGNGLSFTAVSELAGGAWAGRALGAQNTGQNLASALTPGVLGVVITATGYGVAFAISGALALVAAVLTPGDPHEGVGEMAGPQQSSLGAQPAQ